MITEITVTHPSPNINLGGRFKPYTADITFSVCVDSTELSYKRVKITGITKNNWTTGDIRFLESVFNIINKFKNKKLKDMLDFTSST